MNKIMPAIAKLCMVVVIVVSIFLTSFLTIVSAAQAWAQCGNDSYAECSGGVRCTATDQVGCSCYDASGHRVDHHSCKDADPGGGGGDLPLDDPEN